MIPIRVVLLALCCSLAACATPAPPAPTATKITLWQGGCYYAAGCKDESFTLEPDGRFVVESRERALDGTVSQSKHQGQIDAQAFRDAAAFLESEKFDAMTTRMDGTDKAWRSDAGFCMPHAPGARITREDSSGASREVFWDMGCQSQAMSAFLAKLKAAMRTSAMAEPPTP